MPTAPSRLRAWGTAASAAAGGALAWWHWRGPWAAALAITMGGLLLLAVFLPRAYAPVLATLDRVVQALLQVLTWMLLGLVFVLVFIPGRIVLALWRRDPLDRGIASRPTTTWHEVRRARDPAHRFRRPF